MTRATLEIVDVFPDAVKVRADSIRQGDLVFTAVGDRIPVRHVRVHTHRVSFIREDGARWSWARADVVTIVRSA